MQFVVKAKVHGVWHQIETITEREAGGKVQAYLCAKRLAAACQQFDGTTETAVTRS